MPPPPLPPGSARLARVFCGPDGAAGGVRGQERFRGKQPSSASQPEMSRPSSRQDTVQRASPHQRLGLGRRGRPNWCGTTFSRRMREMRFLRRCRSRQRGLYADGARHNGLREVEEARPSGLNPYRIFPQNSQNFPQNSQMFFQNSQKFRKIHKIFRKPISVP